LIEADDRLSIDEVRLIQANHAPVWAEEVLPYVLDLTPEDPRLQEAVELLRAWDGCAERNSAAAALLEAFRLHLIDATFSDELGDDLLAQARPKAMRALPGLLTEETSTWFDDVKTPERESRDDVLHRALSDAVEELSETLGTKTEAWRWGDLHTATFENQSLGQCGIGLVESLFNRGPIAVDGSLGTVNQADYSLSEPYAAQTIASYRQIIDLADLSRSVSMHTTGQSGHPFHRHYEDMIEPWRDVKVHPMLWERADVEENATETLVLTP
jgi:penicillin amidase